VFQDPLGALDRRLPIATQTAEPLEIHGIGGASARAGRVEALLRAVGFRPDQGLRYPHELSGGQRQRAVLARALATDPALLVCDEPISAPDVSIQAQVMNLLLDLQEQFGTAMLFVSHDLRAVRQVSHRLAVMYLGRIVEEGEPDAVLHKPAYPYSRALVRGLGASPWRIYGRHVLPNIASTLIVSMTLAFPEVILLESGLSFLGLGVQPPETSLGSMVGYGREYLTRAPWILLAPASTIVLTTLSVSLIGDWLRDGLDPTLR
jgi:ABC-type proline/glycine betaine transport system ATPase subunit